MKMPGLFKRLSNLVATSLTSTSKSIPPLTQSLNNAIYYKFHPAFHFLMPELSEVRRYTELFVRMSLVRSEGSDYVPAVLSV
jgi:hypothetical protein